MRVVLLLLAIGLLPLSVGVVCLSVVQIRLIREVAALREAQHPAVMLSPAATGLAISEALLRHRRASGRGNW